MAVLEGIFADQNLEISLVRQFARGDQVAARDLFDSFCDPLVRFVLRRTTCSPEDAEDIACDTFMAAFDLAHTFDGSCSILTWLCSIARYRIIDHRRRRQSSRRIPEASIVSLDDASRQAFLQVHDASVSPETLVDRMDHARIVQALLDSLSPEQREAVVMRHVEGFSVAEIARVMRRSCKAVERLLERAKERPRREVLNWLGDEGFHAFCFEVLMI